MEFPWFGNPKWIGKKSTPCHTATLTEADLQRHLVSNFSDAGIPDTKKAKEILDCIENYFIGARKAGKNAVWYGWFTQLCMRSPSGREATKIKWHKPYFLMLRALNKENK